MPLKDLRNALTEVEQTVPFCTAATVHLASGREFPSQIGGNCIFQLHVFHSLVASFEEEGYFLRDHSSQESIHYCRISKVGGMWYYWDPYLLAREPIVLPIPFDFKYEKRYKAAPAYKARSQVYPSEIVITAISRTAFRVEKFLPCSGSELDSSYIFDTAKPAVLPQKEDPFIAAHSRPYFYLRLVAADEALYEVAFHTRKQTFMIERWGGAALHRVHVEAQPQFAATLHAMAEAVGMDVDGLRRFFHETVGLHAELRKNYM